MTQAMFKASVKEINRAWKSKYKKGTFLSQLDQQYEVSKIYLKSVRQFGFLLKTAHKTYTTSGRPPQKLNKFLRVLGQYKDVANAGEKTSKKKKELREKVSFSHGSFPSACSI